MLEDPRHGIEGLTLPKGGSIRDQTFADDTALYFKGDQSNMDKVQNVLKIFCKASGAKINWNKSAAIWASRRERTWNWGREEGLKWVPKGEGVRYLGVQVGFRLPTEANFDKMMVALKGKLINWGHKNLSLAGRIQVGNQVLLASMWYMAACWNPNPRMCSQVRGVIRNFIWGGKATPARAKVKWETLTLPISKGGLDIIDPKTQFEALLAKLLVRGLAPGDEPWKELIRHHADQTKLLVNGKGPCTSDINWIFAAPKLKRAPCSMWKSILGAWINIRPGLTKSDLSSMAEMLRQPLFGNPSFTNTNGAPLCVSGQSEGCAFARYGHTRVKDMWNQEAQEWKSLLDLGMHFHVSNRNNKDIIIGSIPRRPDTFDSSAQPGDWIGNIAPSSGAPLDWVYYVLESLPNKTIALEFRRILTNGQIRGTSHQTHSLRSDNHFPVRVLSQEGHGATFRIARELPSASKRTTSYWIFESGFIKDLPWDPGEWHWKATHPLGDAPFFGYTAKRGYKNAKGPAHSPGITTFIQNLNLRNSTTPQVIARI